MSDLVMNINLLSGLNMDEWLEEKEDKKERRDTQKVMKVSLKSWKKQEAPWRKLWSVLWNFNKCWGAISGGRKVKEWL